MTWTYLEFAGRLDDRAETLHRRDIRLISWLVGLVGFGMLFVVFVSPISRTVALTGGKAAIAGLAALAVYILGSTGRYSREHGVACPTCGISLLGVADQLEMLDEHGVPLPASINCEGCGAEIIADTA